MAKKKVGRPRLPGGEKRKHVVVSKLNDDEMKALRRRAKDLGLSRSETVREAVRRFLFGSAAD